MNKSLTLLGLDPLLLGGGHAYPLGFIGTFNLPEISSYIGILPVMGLIGLLARRHRRCPRGRPVVDLVRHLGRRPLPHLGRLHPRGPSRLRHPPLQPPAAAEPQPARGRPGPGRHLRHLGGPHVHPGIAGAGPRAGPLTAGREARAAEATAAEAEPTGEARGRGTDERGRQWTSDVVLPLVPVAAVLALQLTLLAGGPWLHHLMHVPGVVTRSTLWPLDRRPHHPERHRRRRRSASCSAGTASGAGCRLLLVALVVLDLAVFNVGIQSTPDPGAASSARAPRPTGWRPWWRPRAKARPAACTGSGCSTPTASTPSRPTGSGNPT